MKDIYNAVIIGCGNIGALKPDVYDFPGKTPAKTLAHAIYKNPRVNLKYLADADFSKAEKAAKKWGVELYYSHSYPSLSICWLDSDLIVISTNTESHVAIAETLGLYSERFDTSNKIVMIEKPVGENYEEANRIKRYLSDYKAVMVDYSRKYAKEFHRNVTSLVEWKDEFRGEHFLTIYSCIIYYNRGLYRDGCHAIDFVEQYLGKIKKAEQIPGTIIEDYSSKDPTVTVRLQTEKCANIFMIPVDGRKVSLFEIEMMTSEGKLILESNGNVITWKGLVESDYGDYRTLDNFQEQTIVGTACLDDMLDAYIQEAIHILDGDNSKPSCGIDAAIRVHEIISQIKEV